MTQEKEIPENEETGTITPDTWQNALAVSGLNDNLLYSARHVSANVRMSYNPTAAMVKYGLFYREDQPGSKTAFAHDAAEVEATLQAWNVTTPEWVPCVLPPTKYEEIIPLIPSLASFPKKKGEPTKGEETQE